jgi:hypothetical protein
MHRVSFLSGSLHIILYIEPNGGQAMKTAAANLASDNNPLTAFQWKPQPAAEALVRGVLEEFLARTPFAATLARRMKEETGTRFLDWVDSIAVAPAMRDQLTAAGFETAGGDGPEAWTHPGGMFPSFVIDDAGTVAVSIRTESVADFAVAMGLELNDEAGPLANYRRMLAAKGDGTELWAVERHGYRGFEPQHANNEGRVNLIGHSERLRTRRRIFDTDAEGFGHASTLIDEAIHDLGRDLACDVFFAAEREYWQRRNRAAQIQKARQGRLGLGWANHDHHTYRSSREQFTPLIAVLEKMGFVCRERFYAGAQAGWGAQVLEQPAARVVIFADVDLSPEELLNDFSHEGLVPRHELGTVGLWCALHGEAFLQAGMHHLECQFDFSALKEQLETTGVKLMKPFTDFPYLRQAFTEGEIWPVRPERIDRLLARNQITPEQAQRFREHGAIGSHLENLERNDGFKGFNQTGVSDIIQRTDPRARHA